MREGYIKYHQLRNVVIYSNTYPLTKYCESRTTKEGFTKIR